MAKGSHKLIYKFAFGLAIFSLFILVFTGLATFFNQKKVYNSESIDKIRRVGEYLTDLILEQDEDFVYYQEYYMSHFEQINIPYNFSEYNTAKAQWEKIRSEEMAAMGEKPDYAISDFSEMAQELWFIYMHEFWILTFEKAREAFSLPYTYYLVPKEDIYYIVYMIDGERTPKTVDGKEYIYLGDEYYDDPELYAVQWNTWFTGKRQSTVQVWDNSWGHTYAYYIPLIINGQKMGLVGTECSVDTVNKTIFKAVITQVLFLFIFLVIGVICILLFVNHFFISKIVRLETSVRKYSVTKDFRIAQKIENDIKGKDEISSLAKRISEMILELENYMRNIFATEQDLDEERLKAIRGNDTIRPDALTGIRTGASLEKEMALLGTEKSGEKKFGFAVADLNDLKKINGSYGIEQGNEAIKKLCSIVCHVFSHSPVFRTGGDEFTVILSNDDLKNIDSLVAAFNEKLIQVDENIEPWEDISAALGYAVFTPSLDATVQSVVARAEQAMRERKKEMKSVRKL